MITLNVILSRSKEEDCYVVNCLELDIVGTGREKQDAVRELGTSIQIQIDEARANQEATIMPYHTPPPNLRRAFERIILNPHSSPRVMEIPGYCTLHVYDMNDKNET